MIPTVLPVLEVKENRTYKVTSIYIKGHDGDEEYRRLQQKIATRAPLEEDDILKSGAGYLRY